MLECALITGAGGDIAQSAAAILRRRGLAKRLVGADCRADNAAAAYFDETVILPRADDPVYLEHLNRTITMSAPDVVIPLSEAELGVLLDFGLIGERIGPSALICANRQVLEVGLDKWRTFTSLRDAGIDMPLSGIVGVHEPEAFPVIVKPRRGQGSKSIQLCDEPEYWRFSEFRAGDLWQEFLPDDEGEFTCGVVRFPQMGCRSLTFRRELRGGLTGQGFVQSISAIDRLLETVCDALNLRGAMNVQLRMVGGEPRIFEINPRFSSTVGFRDRLGFADLQWSIEDRLGIPIGDYAAPCPGTRIYRVSDEVVLPPLP